MYRRIRKCTPKVRLVHNFPLHLAEASHSGWLPGRSRSAARSHLRISRRLPRLRKPCRSGGCTRLPCCLFLPHGDQALRRCSCRDGRGRSSIRHCNRRASLCRPCSSCGARRALLRHSILDFVLENMRNSCKYKTIGLRYVTGYKNPRCEGRRENVQSNGIKNDGTLLSGVPMNAEISRVISLTHRGVHIDHAVVKTNLEHLERCT